MSSDFKYKTTRIRTHLPRWRETEAKKFSLGLAVIFDVMRKSRTFMLGLNCYHSLNWWRRDEFFAVYLSLLIMHFRALKKSNKKMPKQYKLVIVYFGLNLVSTEFQKWFLVVLSGANFPIHLYGI